MTTHAYSGYACVVPREIARCRACCQIVPRQDFSSHRRAHESCERRRKRAQVAGTPGSGRSAGVWSELRSRSREHQSILQRLYDPSFHQCTACGWRLPQSRISAHLDEHFLERISQRDREDSGRMSSRGWYTSSWCTHTFSKQPQTQPQPQPQPQPQTTTVANSRESSQTAHRSREPRRDQDLMVCTGCGEPLEFEWDDDADEWLYLAEFVRHPTRPRLVLHRTCLSFCLTQPPGPNI